MQHADERPVNINPDKQTAETNRLRMQPGPVEENETASAYANRTGQSGITGKQPERAQLNQQNQEEQRGDRTAEHHSSDTAPRTDNSDGPGPLTSAADPMR